MVTPPDWPTMEPRSSTLDRIDDAIKAVEQARRGVLDEVAQLGVLIDELRKERQAWRDRAIAAERELERVICEASRAVESAKNPRR